MIRSITCESINQEILVERVREAIGQSPARQQHQLQPGIDLIDVLDGAVVVEAVSKQEILEDVRGKLEAIPGIVVNVGQPLSHRIDHVLSGVRAQLAIKIFGDDLRTLRNKAAEIESLVSEIDGIVDLSVEQMVLTPHIHVNVDRNRILNRGMSIGEVAEYAQVALNGKTVSEIIDHPVV